MKTQSIVTILICAISFGAAKAEENDKKENENQPCSTQKTEEAEFDYKNCVESSQVTVIRLASELQSESDDLDPVCSAISNMVDLCRSEWDVLSSCKGRSHAEKIKLLHLSVTQSIVGSFLRHHDVKDCKIFDDEHLEESRKKNEAEYYETVKDDSEAEPSAEAESESENGARGLSWSVLTQMLVVAIYVLLK